MTRHRFLLTLGCLFLLASMGRVWASRDGNAPPIHYSGVVLRDGVQVTDGMHMIGLSLWTTPTGVTGGVCDQAERSVTTTAGHFSLVVDEAACVEALADGTGLYVALTVDGVALSPRSRIPAVPYSLRTDAAAQEHVDATATKQLPRTLTINAPAWAVVVPDGVDDDTQVLTPHPGSASAATAAGNDLGLSWTPTRGKYRVCAEFTWGFFAATGPTSGYSRFKLAETPADQHNILQEGRHVAQIYATHGGTGGFEEARPVEICGTFLFTDTQPRTVRLFHSTGGRMDASKISFGDGTADLHWLVTRL